MNLFYLFSSKKISHVDLGATIKKKGKERLKTSEYVVDNNLEDVHEKILVEFSLLV